MKKRSLFIKTVGFLALFILPGCSKDSWDLFEGDPTIDALPVVTITDVERTASGPVKVSFSVTASENASELRYMGVCYSDFNTEPSMLENQMLYKGEVGDFFVLLSDLKNDSTYFIRAFVTNNNGYTYSETYTYTVAKPLPVVPTCSYPLGEMMDDGSDYTINSAFAGANLGDPWGEYGMQVSCYNSGGPTYKLYFSEEPQGGTFTTTSDFNDLDDKKGLVYIIVKRGWDEHAVQSGGKLYINATPNGKLDVHLCNASYLFSPSNPVNTGGHFEVTP